VAARKKKSTRRTTAGRGGSTRAASSQRREAQPAPDVVSAPHPGPSAPTESTVTEQIPGWRRPLRWWYRQHDLRREVIAATVLAVFPLVGFGSWYIGDLISQRKSERVVREAFQISQYEERMEVYAAFADGIPENLDYVNHIAVKTAWLDMNTEASSSATYFDGRSYREISEDLEDARRSWLRDTTHYAALCEQVRTRFHGTPAETGAEVTRQLLDGLIDVLPNPDVLEEGVTRLRAASARMREAGFVDDPDPDFESWVRSLETDPTPGELLELIGVLEREQQVLTSEEAAAARFAVESAREGASMRGVLDELVEREVIHASTRDWIRWDVAERRLRTIRSAGWQLTLRAYSRTMDAMGERLNSPPVR